MYANYLIDVGKLIFILGENQTTSQFRNLFQSGGSSKEKIFYKCMEQIPADTFKKEKAIEQKGIIRKDWFNKILNKNPQMIVMTFNCSSQLAGKTYLKIENQLWQDRLKVIIKKINRVYDLMRSNSKDQVRLRIIILISKHTFGGVNLHEKITGFLKTYQKELFIIQIELYGKQLSKLRVQWMFALQKNYDNKYRKIEKRKDDSVQERRLGCSVKMAILSEVLTKKDQRERYKEAYKAIKTKFIDSIKSVGILNHNKIRQLRAVGDIVFLRSLKSEISSDTSVKTKFLFQSTFEHMNFFKLKNLGLHETNKYFYYEELLWRCTFIESFLQLVYKNDLLVDDKTIIVSLCELVNEVVTYFYALGSIETEIGKQEENLGGKKLQYMSEDYVGLVRYKAQQVTQADVVFTFLCYLREHNRDFLSKGIQLILRYKTMNIFLPFQLIFLNIYLLKLYIKDNKINNAISLLDQVLLNNQNIINNLYIVNQILQEIQSIQPNNLQKIKINLITLMVCDYFQNQQLNDKLSQLLENTEKLSLTNSENQIQSLDKLKDWDGILRLKKNSGIVNVVCDIDKQFVFMQETVVIKLTINLNDVFRRYGVKISVKFDNGKADKEMVLEKGYADDKIERELIIKPIQMFTKDDTLKIVSIRVQALGVTKVKMIIPHSQINFSKHSYNKITTNIKCPQVDIELPHPVLYINEVTLFKINIQKFNNLQIDAKFSIKEEDLSGKTEVFLDIISKINLTNCNYYQQLNTNSQTLNNFWLKCNKLGEKSLKLTFHFTIQKNNTENLLHQEEFSSSKLIKQSFTVTRQLKFTIKELFNITKTFHQFSNDDNRILLNKNIPVAKKILGLLELNADEDVLIKQMGQHSNPKRVTYLKQIQKRELLLKKSTKIKLNTIFYLPPDCADQIQLFLSSLYIKWIRMNSALIFGSQPHSNLFLDQQVKINCFTNQLSLFIRASQNFLFKKNQLSKIILSVQNHSKNKYHIFVVLQGNGAILRVGEKGKQTFVDSDSQKKLQFDVLPIVSGFLTIPTIKVFVDGVQRNLNIKNGQVIKCF